MFDVLVIGGSLAGLSAAMQVARARRKVCVVDAGSPRNRFAAESHGFFGQDGVAPLQMIATAREKLLAYPNVTFMTDIVTKAAPAGEDFEVVLASGTSFHTAKLILAFGLTDEMPLIPGLAERWGHSVLHCPYCHGDDFGGAPARASTIVAASPLCRAA